MHKAVRTLCFMALATVMSLVIFSVYSYGDGEHARSMFEDFYALDRDSLDAVWIGSSVINRCWVASEGYADVGVATYGMATGAQPFRATKDLVIECEKTQSPVAYLVDVRMLSRPLDISDSRVRRITSNMRKSANWLDVVPRLTGELASRRPEELQEPLSYYLDFLVFHSRRDITSRDFGCDPDAFLGYYLHPTTKWLDAGAALAAYAANPIALDERDMDCLEEFLDFCDERHLNVVFTNVPASQSEEQNGRMNMAGQIVRERGYEYLNLYDHMDEMGLDYATDFYDEMHVNTQGALKVTSFVASWLKDRYGLPDHRGDARYAMFEDAHERFQAALAALESEEG